MLLLDTHALLWFVRGDQMSEEALHAIGAAQNFRTLYVSAITAWEVGNAERKHTNRPELGTTPEMWFRQALRLTGAKLATITPAIAAATASVPVIYGRGDPGDCFLIATAKVRRLSLVTRDGSTLQLARDRPHYIQTVEC